MSEVVPILLWTLLAGTAMPLGALVARIEKIRPQWLEEELRHSVIAFGGGALLSAIALVLVPEGIVHLSGLQVALCFLSGGAAFLCLDRVLASRNRKGTQLVAMMADFVPEAIALGAAFGSGSSTGPLLAVVIALQNFPEGFNAYREVVNSASLRPTRAILIFCFLALFGPVCGMAGHFLLSDAPEILGGIMIFASGGILYLIFQDIAPQAKLEKHWAPPLGAVLGFLLGLLAHMFVKGL